jgi:glutamate/tyrosine decarboxylase-like PLP-dependent enzyme
MTLKHYGVDRFRTLVDRSLDLTLLATELFDRSPALEVLARPQLGVVCFRYAPEKPVAPDTDRETFLERLNETLVNRVHESGHALLSTTRLNGCYAIRFCPMNHRTRVEDVVSTIALIERLGREVEAEMREKV